MGEIARGGQGAVLRARDARLGKLVALKLLFDTEPRSLLRFQEEAKILARLSHPHLPAVFDLGQESGHPYLAMELIDGEDLGSIVRTRGVPELAWTVDVVCAVAEALDYCHGQGLVHRDLKPGNVLIERGSGRVVLADFGLVKRDRDQFELTGHGERLSLTGELLGTPAFMSPEQADASAGELGPRTDVYALGATLYYLLTGDAPFQGAATYNLIVKVLQTPAPDPRATNPDVPPAVARLCQRAMAKQPSARPPSASAFAEALRVAADPAAAGARGGGAGSRLALALLCVLLLVGLLGVAFLAGRSSTVPEPAAGAEERLPPVDVPPTPVDSPPADVPKVARRVRHRAGSFERDLGEWFGGALVVFDGDGDGVQDLFHLVRVPGDPPGEFTSLVGVSGRTGEKLFVHSGPVNKYSRFFAERREGRAPRLVVPQGKEGQQELAWVDPRSGRVVQGPFLFDGRRGNRKGPLNPLPLDREGTGRLGVVLCSDGVTQGGPKHLGYVTAFSAEGRELWRLTPPELGVPQPTNTGLMAYPIAFDARGRATVVMWFLDKALTAIRLPSAKQPKAEVLWTQRPSKRHQLYRRDGSLELDRRDRRVLVRWTVGWRGAGGSPNRFGVELAMVDPFPWKEHWRRVLPGNPLHVLRVDLDGDGRTEVVLSLLLTQNNWDSPVERILVLDGRTGRTLARRWKPNGARVLDVCRTSDGRSLLVGGQQSAPFAVHYYDPKTLELVGRQAAGAKGLSLVTSPDLDGDGVSELVVREWHSARLIVTKPDPQPID